ncbi:hypothetical protein Purlil1_1367 [Purpureocillium lilacinum]|uniref:Uncharacterized protein n=1 Tax=Purpureocillium lilacinum TaxID=33203 RepID=A0ABR0CCV4_PURLI|nr:hypothetical protein Purlil1_1367 [Purpureocillium lilacinum]
MPRPGFMAGEASLPRESRFAPAWPGARHAEWHLGAQASPRVLATWWASRIASTDSGWDLHALTPSMNQLRGAVDRGCFRHEADCSVWAWTHGHMSSIVIQDRVSSIDGSECLCCGKMHYLDARICRVTANKDLLGTWSRRGADKILRFARPESRQSPACFFRHEVPTCRGGHSCEATALTESKPQHACAH